MRLFAGLRPQARRPLPMAALPDRSPRSPTRSPDAHRPQPGAQGGAPGSRVRGPVRRQGAHHRRQRRGQGSRRAPDSHAQPPAPRADAHHQLRGDARHAARIRALRPRPRQLHRRLSRQARPVRGGQRRHRVPGRSGRDVAAHAGAAAPLPRNRRDPARRRRAQPRQRQRARGGGHQPPAAGAHRSRRLPRRPLLPAERDPHHDSAAARTRATTSRRCSSTSCGSSRVEHGVPLPALLARRGGRAREPTTGRATCASCATSPSASPAAARAA